MKAHDFEKDDDTNFHIDFLTVGTFLSLFFKGCMSLEELLEGLKQFR